MIHVMLDLETLGNKIGSPVISIGACYDLPEQPRKKFYCVVDLDEQLRAGLIPNHQTLAWWSTQSPEALSVLNDPTTITCAKAFSFFREFLPTQDFMLWGYGANFDQPMLEFMFNKVLREEQPWKYNSAMCFRTLRKLYPNIGHEIPNIGVAHNALADAEWQLNYLNALIKRYEIKF